MAFRNPTNANLRRQQQGGDGGSILIPDPNSKIGYRSAWPAQLSKS